MKQPRKSEIIKVLRDLHAMNQRSYREADGRVRDPEIIRENLCIRTAIKIVKQSKIATPEVPA